MTRPIEELAAEVRESQRGPTQIAS